MQIWVVPSAWGCSGANTVIHLSLACFPSSFLLREGVACLVDFGKRETGLHLLHHQTGFFGQALGGSSVQAPCSCKTDLVSGGVHRGWGGGLLGGLSEVFASLRKEAVGEPSWYGLPGSSQTHIPSGFRSKLPNPMCSWRAVTLGCVFPRCVLLRERKAGTWGLWKHGVLLLPPLS